MLKKIFLLTLFLTAIVGGFYLTNSQNQAQAIYGGGACKWVNSGQIHCAFGTTASSFINNIKDILDQAEFSPSEVPVVGGTVSSVDITKFDEAVLGAIGGAFDAEDDYYFDPTASKNTGYPVFCGGKVDVSNSRCLHFVSNNPMFGYATLDGGKVEPVPSGDAGNWIAVANISKALSQSGDNCGITKTTNCNVDDGDGMPGGTYNGDGADLTTFVSNTEALIASQELKQQCEREAPLGFILCPIFNGIVDGIGSLIGGTGISGEREGLLISFLTIQPLTVGASGDAENPAPVLQQVVGNIIGVANLFYIVIFLLIIFSSSLPLGLDNYSIKKMLPKFIAAVIMTQFAYPICGIIVDLFNLLGQAVPNIIFGLTVGVQGVPDPAGGIGAAFQQGLQAVLITNFAAAGVAFFTTIGWLLMLILLIVLIVAVIVGLIYIVLRYLIIYILVLLSPIAFACWVLPGTEKFFYSWWKNFIRVNAVFPMITGLLAVAIVLAQVLINADSTNGAIKLVAMLIPVVALFMVPKTLKWTTQGMNALAAGALGFAAGKMGAGAKAVGKGAQTAGKKGYSYGKDKGIDFGKRKGVEFLGRRGFSNTAIEREKGRQLSDERKKGDLRYSNMDLDQASASLNRSMAALAKNPHDIKAQADVHAGLARLNQLGGAGRKKIGIAQNQFRAAGGAYSTWASALGDSGVFGDLDEKSPELTLDWSSQPAPAGAPPGTPPSPPAAFFSEDGIRNVNITNGNQSITTLTSTDVSKKGAPDLGSLGSTTVQSMADIDTGLEAVQYGQHINWQAAATMASTPQMHPKDATTIQHWQKVGQRGVQYWENVGNQAAAAGNQALFDQATQNQAHAQAIVDGFGG